MTRLFKKVLPILVIATLIISMFTINASAAGSTIAFSKNKLQVGETLTVTARFSTASGNPMVAPFGCPVSNALEYLNDHDK